MQLPPGMTEEDLVRSVQTTAKKLSSLFKFGSYTQEDIEQEAWIIILKPDRNGKNLLDRYDGVRPLENILYVHIHNRLCNFKRDKYERLAKPCLTCPLYINEKCSEFHNELACALYEDWFKKTAPKKSLVNAAEMSTPSNEGSYEHRDDDIDSKLLFELIDRQLPIIFREDYVKIKHGVKVGRRRTEEVLAKIREIMVEHGYSAENWVLPDGPEED